MASIPKRVKDRFRKSIVKFQNVLKVAKDRDVNESDTVSITSDMLAEVFGYDKYTEITREYAIRGTYCDLAIKTNDSVEFLIEVKAIGMGLKASHLRQAINYGATKAIQWVILTNSISWEIYKIKFEKSVGYDFVCSFNMLDITPKSEEDQGKLFIICKEGLSKDAREDFHARVKSVNRYSIGAILLRETMINSIRRELRRLSPGIKIDFSEIENILRNEVLKRDAIEGDEAKKAQFQIKRLYKKASNKKTPKQASTNKEISRKMSFSDHLIKDEREVDSGIQSIDT